MESEYWPLMKLLHMRSFVLAMTSSRSRWPKSTASTLCPMDFNEGKWSSCYRNGAGMPSLSNPHEVVLSRDVLITLVKDRQEAERPQPIVGPRRVQNHLKSVAATCSQSASATNADPWLSPTNDPWQAFMSNKPSDRDPRPSKRYDQLATQLKTDLAAQL